MGRDNLKVVWEGGMWVISWGDVEVLRVLDIVFGEFLREEREVDSLLDLVMLGMWNVEYEVLGVGKMDDSGVGIFWEDVSEGNCKEGEDVREMLWRWIKELVMMELEK
jgi:hypothetical protein